MKKNKKMPKSMFVSVDSDIPANLVVGTVPVTIHAKAEVLTYLVPAIQELVERITSQAGSAGAAKGRRKAAKA